MALSLYDATIPVFVRGLRNLSFFLDKAEASGADVKALSDARLYEDMHQLNRQIHLASDAAKSGAARLAGVAPPSFPDVEVTFPELRERIAKTIAFLEGIKPEQLNGREDATVELPLPGRTMTFKGQEFLLNFALPNFLFHVTTAYAILRSQGVPLGKMDYLAGGVQQAA